MNIHKLMENLDAGSNPNYVPEFTIHGGGNLQSEYENSPNMPTFILDGFAYWRPQTRYLVKNFDFYFHTNMGWGGYYDGFYLVNKDLSITFDTSNGSYDRNFSMIYNIINK